MDESLDQYLYRFFGYRHFKTGQKEILRSLFQGENVIGILPTGGGKSLCYQLFSQLTDGLTLIVSPLISLMEDQLLQLQLLGEKHCVALNSQLSFEEKQIVMKHLANYKYCFISPEMLQQKEIMEVLQRIKISLFVVDEVHCMSQWGIDFRPEYLSLQEVRLKLNFPLTLALTATVTPDMLDTVTDNLFSPKENLKIYQYSSNRENIAYQVVNCNNHQEKREKLFHYLACLEGPGIIYCSTRKAATDLQEEIQRQFPNLKVAAYHGGMTSNERRLIQMQFLKNQLTILCATNAFGMGINKKDIRFVLHYHVPASLDHYLQETGRGGRDGGKSIAILLYNPQDFAIYQRMQQAVGLQAEELRSWLMNEKAIPFETLTELQQKWLLASKKKHQNFESMYEEIQLNIHQKKNQKIAMQQFAELKTCRRIFLLNYFSEKEKYLPQMNCCDICGIQIAAYNVKKVTNKQNEKSKKNWEDIIKSLFFKEI